MVSRTDAINCKASPAAPEWGEGPKRGRRRADATDAGLSYGAQTARPLPRVPAQGRENRLTVTTTPNLVTRQQEAASVRAWAIACAGVVLVLMAALYWPNLLRLWAKVNPIDGAQKDNWSHSILVPVLGIYYLWTRREDLRRAEVRPLLPASRWPWLLAGGAVLAFFGGVATLFAWRVPDSPFGGQPLPYAIAGIVGGLAMLLDLVVTGRSAGRSRVLGGALIVAAGVAGQFLFDSSLGTDLVGTTLAGYAGPLCFGVAVLGGLILLLDWGLGTLLAGLLLSGYGIWPGQNDYLKDLGLVLTLFGVVLTLGGWQIMRIAWFPIAFLVCAIPWPGLVYSKVALPLQFLAAKVAVVVMNLSQVETYVEGTRMVISNSGEEHVLNVEEACAGMRSLMTFITAGAAIGFIFGGERPLWQRLLIVASAVPIAIICNVGRVSGMGVSYVYVSEAVAEGFTHKLVGLVMLVPAFFMLIGVVWILDHLFVEVEDDDEPAAATAPTPRTA